MSQQGEAHHREDAWWRQLYEADDDTGGAAEGAGATGGAGAAGTSLDDHFTSALTAIGDGPDGGSKPPPGDPTPPVPPAPAPTPLLDGLFPATAAPTATGRPPSDGALWPGAAWPGTAPEDDAWPAGEPSAWPVADPDALADLPPDTVLDGLGHGPLAVRAASARGEDARRQGLARTDELLTARFGHGADEVLFLAVVSGGPAARDACRELARAVAYSGPRLAGDLRAARHVDLRSGLQRLTDRAYGRLRAAGEDGAPGHALRCLLLTGDPGCRMRVFFGAGPGGLFRLRDGRWQDLDPAAPGRGQAVYQGFRFHAGAARRGDALLLCCEGFAGPLREVPGLARRLADRWGPHRQPPALAGFLTDLLAHVEGYAQDRTAVVVWDR